MIAVIDYGVGNLKSVVNALEIVGGRPNVVQDPAQVRQASAIVLPGVGAFGDGMRELERLQLVEALNEEVVIKGKPFLGICLGMQFLGRLSYEHGSHAGLGWLDGVNERIAPPSRTYRVPHIGWNELRIERPSALFRGLGDAPVFYFLHSYHLAVDAAASAEVTSSCFHGDWLVASVEKRNIYGVQFHPEKSQESGLALLRNFVGLI